MWPKASSLPHGVSVSLSGQWSQYHSLHWIDVRIRIMFQAHGQASVHIRFISEQTRSFAHPSRKMACPKMEHVTSLVMTTWSSENKQQFHQASHWCRDESLEHSLVLVLTLSGHALKASAMGRSQAHQVHFAYCVILPTCHFPFQSLSLLFLPTGMHTPLPPTIPVKGHHSLLELRNWKSFQPNHCSCWIKGIFKG